MTDWYVRLGVTAALSIGAHALVVELVALLPEEDAVAATQQVEISIVAPPEPPKPPEVPESIEPPPEPPKPAEPVPPPPPPKLEPPKEMPKQAPPKQAPPTAATPPPKVTDSPPPDPSAKPTDTGDTPVFGVTMESTSQGGAGPAVKVGNTLAQRGGAGAQKAPDDKRPAAGTGSGTEPVAAYEVTKMPLPQGRCAGKYTEEAKAAGTEGVVVLDLVVDAKGRATDITVVQGLEHGLTEAAIAALRACTFTPGEKAGQAVPVKVRGFKIRFVMDQP